MRELVYYLAVTLDGFIARENGDVDWCFTDRDYGFRDFLDSVDTLITGRLTWEQALAFEAQPFPGKEIFVFSRSAPPGSLGRATLVKEPLPDFAARLKSAPGKTVWLLGGAQIAGQCLCHGLIDRFVLHVHPLILGRGIPLFQPSTRESGLELVGTQAWESGMVRLEYLRKPVPA